MKRALISVCIMLLTFTVSYSFAQMGGGMMGGEQRQMMQPGQGEKQNPQTETVGAKIFGENCTSCHPNGGNIIVPGLPVKGSRVLANSRTFVAFIRNPKMPDGSQGSMPSFSKAKISDKHAIELYHFLTSTEGYGMRGGYGMGPGMMRGYGMGQGMMGGYGMGPGMMGRGYGMGQGMMGGYGMGPGMMGYYSQSQECQKFYDETAKLRKELHDKRFEYFEVMRNPKSTGEMAMKLDLEIKELQEKIYANAPLGCEW